MLKSYPVGGNLWWQPRQTFPPQISSSSFVILLVPSLMTYINVDMWPLYTSVRILLKIILCRSLGPNAVTSAHSVHCLTGRVPLSVPLCQPLGQSGQAPAPMDGSPLRRWREENSPLSRGRSVLSSRTTGQPPRLRRGAGNTWPVQRCWGRGSVTAGDGQTAHRGQ